MAEVKNLNVGIEGMMRDVHSHLLSEKTYTFQRNGNIETDEYGGIALTNEHSNLLCSKLNYKTSTGLSAELKVVGNKIDVKDNKIYLFSVVEVRDIKGELRDTYSEIGELPYIHNVEDNEDILSQCGCTYENLFATPLEELESIPEGCTYKTLLRDDCNKCLNFNINYPIKKIELKNEISYKRLYFTDNYNPPRYLDLSDLEQYKTKETEYDLDCGETSNTPTCLDCDKLRVQKLFRTPIIKPTSMQNGGRLRNGSYSYIVAYCDAKGNELSDYYSLTNPIKLFETEKPVMEPKDYARQTNYGIVLELENLDNTQFRYYKIVSIEKSDVNSNTTEFELGVYPIGQKVVLHSINGVDDTSALRRDLVSTLYNRRPIFEKWKGLTASNGHLFGYGYKTEDNLNLQPIINFLGSEVKWHTVIAKENLYKDGVAVSNYTGYMRDETYPLSIQFLYRTGGKSTPFPLIGRVATNAERQTARNLVGYKSFQEYATECSGIDRTQLWQYTNTAKKEGEFVDFIDGTPNLKRTTAISKIEEAEIIEDETFEVPISGYDFDGIQNYVEENLKEIKQACELGDIRYSANFCNFVNKTYPNLHKAPELPFEVVEGELTTRTCSVPTLIEEEVFINSVDNETYKLTPKEWEVDYDRTQASGACTLYTKGNQEDYWAGFIEYEDDIFHDHVRFLDRIEIHTNNLSINDAMDLLTPDDMTINTAFPFSSYLRETVDDYSFFTKYKATITPPNRPFPQKFRGGGNPTSIYGGMFERIHNRALWFKVTKDDLFSAQEGDEPIVIVEVSEQQTSRPNPASRSGTDRGAVEYNPIKDVRLSIFVGKDKDTAIHSEMVNMDEGWWRLFKAEDFGYEEEIFVVLEPYLTRTISIAVLNDIKTVREDVTNIPNNEKFEAGFTWFPTGCFSVYKRYREYTKATIDVDKIVVGKKETYEADCVYLVPNFNNCDGSPYSYGSFAYTESSEIYPDNKELWDSTKLIIDSKDLSLPQNFHSGVDRNGNYILNENSDFRCQNIRHFKFPNNTIAPFMHPEDLGREGETLIYPLGVKLDKEVVLKYLKVALKNGLLSQTQFDNIEGFEILRGDRTMHKSILYKGIAHDMYKYNEGGEDWWFRNFPYNSLGENKLLQVGSTKNVFIKHPYNNVRNTKFSLIAPEIYSGADVTGSEISFEGYQLGYSKGQFNEVEDHPKWVILGAKAEKMASTLATAEVAFERAMNIAKETIQAGQASSGGIFGISISGSIVGGAGLAAVIAINAFLGTRHRYAELKMKWLDAFKSAGPLRNYAHYYASVGNFNFFLPTSNSDSMRALSSYKYLRPGRVITNDITGSDVLRINNLRRESSIFLSLGKTQYSYNYDSNYTTWDNVDHNEFTASRYLASKSVCSNNIEEADRNVGSPYISVRNYLPNQYGDINSVIWLNTGKVHKFNRKETEVTFGGDVVISKVAFKTKFPFFFSDAMKLGDRVGFNYYAYGNVGKPRYYVTYDTVGSELSGKIEIPYLTSDYNLNCPSDDVFVEKSMYVDPEKKNHKFFLYYYGISHYFVESEINNHFRIAGVEPHESFYPFNQDYVRMTQESNVSINNDNIYYYNSGSYNFSNYNSGWLNLPSDYKEELYKKSNNVENGIVWSRQDKDEMNLFDPWLAFRPLDNYTFNKSYGSLIDVSPLESEQVLARFENQTVVFNAVDSLADRLVSTSNDTLGTGGIFATRPLEFSKTDLGETGTQHYSMVQTQFGVFWVDAKRGRVFQIPSGGKQLAEISSFKLQGGPSGMSKWFKKHLPFKILKGVKGLEDKHIDNHYNSLGILTWWDSKFNRVFISKRDYVPLRKGIVYNEELGFHIPTEIIKSCNKGWRYNEEKGLCEKEGELCSEKIADISFVVDATTGQREAIDNLKTYFLEDTIPAIRRKFKSYRLSLLVVTDNPDRLVEIKVPFSERNEQAILTALNDIVITDGGNVADAYDVALELLYYNSKEVNYLGQSLEGSITTGEWGANNEKMVFVITDSYPSGLNDAYTSEDETRVINISNLYKSKNILIHTMFTPPTGDNYPQEGVLRNLSTNTGGFHGRYILGRGLREAVVDFVDGANCNRNVVTMAPNEKPLQITQHDKDYFKDVSWTIAYSPLYQCWVSYYDFHPDYAIGNNEYFQTGKNFGGREKGVWSHLLTNKSFQVYYGKLYPWTIEVNNKNEYVNKQLNSVNAWFSSYRYHNDYDFAEQRKRAVNEMYVYNNTNNSGRLLLNYSDAINKAPKQWDETTQQIPATHTDNQVKVNYMFNRVINQDSNIPIWNWDENEINKNLNKLAISFRGKKVLERIKGDVLFTRFTQDKTSLFKHVYKWNVSNEEPLP